MANTLTYNDQTFSVGDTISVSQKILEGDKIRTQIFEGILMAVRGSGNGKSFRVRKIADAAVGVERIWPVMTPMIKKITLKKRGSARRAKLYYLRSRTGKEALQVKTATEKPKPEPAKPAAKKTAKKKPPTQSKK